MTWHFTHSLHSVKHQCVIQRLLEPELLAAALEPWINIFLLCSQPEIKLIQEVHKGPRAHLLKRNPSLQYPTSSSLVFLAIEIKGKKLKIKVNRQKEIIECLTTRGNNKMKEKGGFGYGEKAQNEVQVVLFCFSLLYFVMNPLILILLGVIFLAIFF